MPSANPITVFRDFLSVNTATATFLSAAATVALISNHFLFAKNISASVMPALYCSFIMRLSAVAHRPPAFPKMAALYSDAMTWSKYLSLPQR